MRTLTPLDAKVHFAAAAFLAAFLLPAPSLAHGESSWIGELGLTNANGESCCGETDCHVVSVERVRILPGGYQVPHPSSSGRIFVPTSETLPSRDGRFHICVWGGERKCFFAPPMGS